MSSYPPPPSSPRSLKLHGTQDALQRTELQLKRDRWPTAPMLQGPLFLGSRYNHAQALDTRAQTDCPAQHGGAKRQPLTG